MEEVVLVGKPLALFVECLVRRFVQFVPFRSLSWNHAVNPCDEGDGCSSRARAIVVMMKGTEATKYRPDTCRAFFRSRWRHHIEW